jgi:plastocyanin
MKFTIKPLIVAAVAAFFISLQSGFGATTNVVIGFNGGLVFSPTNVFISQGDSVIWQWANTVPHSTTSGTNGVPGDDNGVPSGLWDSTVVSSAGHMFTNTFTSSDIFSYYCTVHHSEGMTGQVLVASSSVVTTNVTIGFNGGLVFSPTNVFIPQGGAVVWQWANTIPHSTTSGTNGVPGDDNGVPSGLWDSTVVSSAGHMFTNTFTTAGIFSYYCTVHHSEGMTGQVVVASASVITTNVTIGFNGGLVFSPTNVFIPQGSSVVWQWANTIPHSTTSGTNGIPGDDNGVPSGLWDSTVVSSAGHMFTNTFTTAGIFSYYCTVHHSEGMTGQVIVAGSVLVPPTVVITNPLAGAVFAAPASVNILATASGSALITNVQFLVNSVVLANVTTPPFSTVAANLAAGNYTLTAIALDINDLSATNSVAVTVVTPVTTVLSGPLASSGGFQFSYPANVGLDYIIQRSTNFITWETLTTNMAATDPTIFVDVNATNGFNFYRVGLLPNP